MSIRIVYTVYWKLITVVPMRVELEGAESDDARLAPSGEAGIFWIRF